MQVPRPLGQLATVHVGHDHIRQYQTDLARVLLDVAERFAPVAGGPGLVAEGANHSAGSGAGGLFIIHDQDRWLGGETGSAVSWAGHAGSGQRRLPFALPTKRVSMNVVRTP